MTDRGATASLEFETNCYVYVSSLSAWREAQDAYISISNVWRPVQSVYVMVSGSWRLVFQT